MSVRLAGAPVSWGVDFAGVPENPPPGEVLRGLATAGLHFAELGPPGYLPSRTGTLAAHGLEAVATFVFQPFHRRAARDAALAAAREALDWLEIHGGRILVLVDRPEGTRAASAGRPDRAERLSDGDWAAMIETLRRIAALATRRGIRAVIHPHAGSCIEFGDEVDRLVADLVPEEAGLCLDTGHALYAGDDPVALLLQHAKRIEHLHLKDVHPARLAALLSDGAGFWEGVERGVFCPVGDGALDIAGVREALVAIGYDGFATVEQDRRPDTPGEPATDLLRSVKRLEAAGYADPS